VATGQNAIVTENAKPGTPVSEWQIIDLVAAAASTDFEFPVTIISNIQVGANLP
jgi:hypothetical protein